MNKRWMTVAVIALVLMMAVTANLAAQQSVLSLTTHGLNSDDRDNYVANPQSLGSVNKNMIFLTYLPGANGLYSFTTPTNGTFDIGAGLMFGDWRLGVNYTHRASKEYFLEDTTATNYYTDTAAVVTDRDTKGHSNDQYYRLQAQFGNRVWGVNNLFVWTNGVRNDELGTQVTAGNLNPQYTSYSTTYEGTPGKVYGANNSWVDTVSFGMNLTNGLGVFSSFPGTWVKASFGFGKYQNGSIYGEVANGDENRDRNQTINTGGAYGSPSYGSNTVTVSSSSTVKDDLKAYTVLTPGLIYNMGFKLNDNFTLAPRITWAGTYRLYGNNAGNGKVKGDSSYLSGSSTETVTATTNNILNTLYNVRTRTTTTTKDWTTTNQTLRTYSMNAITPHIQLNAAFEGLTLGIRWAPKFTFIGESSNTSGSSTNNTRVAVGETNVNIVGYGGNSPVTTTTVYNSTDITNITGSTTGAVTKTSVFHYQNQFLIGGFYWLKPSKLRLNFGVDYTDVVINKITTTTTTSRYPSTESTTGSFSESTSVNGVPLTPSPAVPGTNYSESGSNTVKPSTPYSTTKTIGTTSGRDDVADGVGNFVPKFRLGATWYVSDNYNFDFYFGDNTTWAGAGKDAINAIVPFNWGIQMNIKW